MQFCLIFLLIITHVFPVTPAPNEVLAKKTLRQKKAHTYPYQYQILVPSLQVIPIHGNRWNENKLNLVPIHELVPVNQLSVIPLQRKDPVYQYHDEDRYRNAIGGYGVGWKYGGHGAGHGFYYGFG
ncbi:unnamed protein product [Pieris brassicae]|uniref:Uncharacterized protein n=1 Tax=Pieris brassicae TaxID=7116 RepID=A0A9P0XCZ0_PIEBR|nr:unnamed protein product [Pieris brassicae]